jgi:glycosyltransferase involved in cell wall biosynthesis
LDRQRFDASICVLRKGGRLEAEIEGSGIPLLELPFTVPARPLSTLPRSLWQAARGFRDHGFDIWHSYHYADDYTEPLIARLSGARAWVYTKKNMSWGGRAWKLRTLLASRVAVQNSVMLTRFFSGPLFRRKVRLLPRGVDTERFHPDVEKRLGIRKAIGVPLGVVLVGCVANLVPVKGVELLIRAIASFAETHLAIAGTSLDVAYAAELHDLCGMLGLSNRVHFLGEVSDVPALHSELDQFVLPTLAKNRMEGCPVALLEAMSCGTPSIATNIPGAQDIIENRISGLLVPAGNSEGLAEAINRVMRLPDRGKTIGEAGRQRILRYYTIEREVARHEALYSELISFNPDLHDGDV